jgi:uncharacterized protein DUF4082
MSPFANRTAQHHKTSRRQWFRSQPLLEALEERALLSTAVDFTVEGSHVEDLIHSSTLGWKFLAKDNIVVNRLGYWDFNDDGLGESHQVGIWDASGNILVEGTVSSGTTAPLDNKFRYVQVPATPLNAGHTYVIGAYMRANGPDNRLTAAANFITDSSIEYVNSRYKLISNLSFPDIDATTVGYGYFGPNFQFTPALPDIAMSSAQLASPILAGPTVEFTYTTTGLTNPFPAHLYLSADQNQTLTTADIPIGDTQSFSPSNPGIPAFGTFILSAPLQADPAHPYLKVVANPDKTIVESDASNDTNNIAVVTLPKLEVKLTPNTDGTKTYTITSEPRMFDIQMKATVNGLPPLYLANAPFDWKTNVEYTPTPSTRFPGRPTSFSIEQFAMGDSIGGSTYGPFSVYQLALPQAAEVSCGHLKIQASVTLAGFQMGGSDEGDILPTNPTEDEVKAYINDQSAHPIPDYFPLGTGYTYYDILRKISSYESRDLLSAHLDFIFFEF